MHGRISFSHNTHSLLLPFSNKLSLPYCVLPKPMAAPLDTHIPVSPAVAAFNIRMTMLISGVEIMCAISTSLP